MIGYHWHAKVAIQHTNNSEITINKRQPRLGVSTNKWNRGKCNDGDDDDDNNNNKAPLDEDDGYNDTNQEIKWKNKLCAITCMHFWYGSSQIQINHTDSMCTTAHSRVSLFGPRDLAYITVCPLHCVAASQYIYIWSFCEQTCTRHALANRNIHTYARAYYYTHVMPARLIHSLTLSLSMIARARPMQTMR